MKKIPSNNFVHVQNTIRNTMNYMYRAYSINSKDATTWKLFTYMLKNIKYEVHVI